MGRILLCMGRYAENPYHFNSVCVNVYCVEELCYLFAANPFMINTDIMDQELAEWLDKECGLTELSHQLLMLFRRGSQPSTFVNTILDYVGYCTEEEKKKIDQVLVSSARLNDYERRKKQADYLLKNGRYRMALDEYESLVRELPETESALGPAIYHNMGTAYGCLFQFEAAAKYFRRSYEMSSREESGVQYLEALRMCLKEGDYIDFIAEHREYHQLSLEVERHLKEAKGGFEASQENRMLTALKILKDEGRVSSYYEEIDRIISELKDEYRQVVAE